ncbi:MAG: DUF3293 domain-containing protein [Bacteroidota bacterium]
MIDQDLQKAYENALYRISKPPISWKVGNYCTELDELLSEHDVEVATFITAYNPGSVSLTAEENQQRNATLQKALATVGYSYLHGQGEDVQCIWTPELSFLVMGMPPEEALTYARQFGQNAVLIIYRKQPVQLLFCTDQIYGY